MPGLANALLMSVLVGTAHALGHVVAMGDTEVLQERDVMVAGMTAASAGFLGYWLVAGGSLGGLLAAVAGVV